MISVLFVYTMSQVQIELGGQPTHDLRHKPASETP